MSVKTALLCRVMPYSLHCYKLGKSTSPLAFISISLVSIKKGTTFKFKVCSSNSKWFLNKTPF